MSDTLQEREDQIVKCECGRLGHSEQVRGLPKGARVKAVTDIAQLGENVRTGTKGTVTGHCSDGRAIVFFEGHQYGHTFHTPNGYIDLLTEEDQTATDYCDECKGHTHAPWCSEYRETLGSKANDGLSREVHKTYCLLCGMLLFYQAPMTRDERIDHHNRLTHKRTIEHEPAARGGGGAAGLVPATVLALAQKNQQIYDTDLSNALVKAVEVAHAEHQALVAERELLVKALRDLLECSRCQNGCASDDMTCATSQADAVLATIEQRSTSE